MRIWLLGGSGFLGTMLQKVCAEKGLDVALTTRQQADIADVDLKGLRDQVERIQPTHIINCAAYTDVDKAESEQDLAYAVNARGPENLGLLTRSYPVKILHVSTDYVFDGKGQAPYAEDDVCAPIGVYGKSKHEGEERLLNVCPSACIVRTSWLFGMRGRNFVSSILGLMQKMQELRVVSDQRGRPTFCKDLALTLLDMLDQEGVFHFANAGERSRYQIAQDIHAQALAMGIPLMCERLIPVSSQQFPTPAPRPAYSVLGTAKIEHVLKRHPRSWEEVLKEHLQHV